MEQNIAALTRLDAYTVGVKFFNEHNKNEIEPKDKEYTYVTNLKLKLGDFVVVLVQNRFIVTQVTRIDSAVDIKPNDPIKYKWIVDRVDFTSYKDNMNQNHLIEEAANELV